MNPKKRSTRDVILQAIRLSPRAKVDELAEAASISPVTVRHHLNSLQAEGLIETHSIRRKVGRPYYVYSLSKQGQEQFPTRYVQLTSRLLDELKNKLPPALLTDLFKSVVQGVIDQHHGEFEQLPIENRLDFLITVLEQEGFLASWEKSENGYKVIEYSCPYLSIGQQHSEVCTIDKELMTTVLQLPIKQHSCMLNGDSCCQFSVITDN